VKSQNPRTLALEWATTWNEIEEEPNYGKATAPAINLHLQRHRGTVGGEVF